MTVSSPSTSSSNNNLDQSNIEVTISQLIVAYEVLVHSHSIVAVESSIKSDIVDKYRQVQELKTKVEHIDFLLNLESVKTVLVRLSKDKNNLLKILDSMADIISNYSLLKDINSKKKIIIPERKENDYIDNVIMRHMQLCLQSYRHHNEMNPSSKVYIPDKIQKICYDRIYNDIFIEDCGKLLGEISSFQLDSVLQILLTSFEKVGKSQTEAKNFLPLQKLTKYLDFSFADEERTEGTLKYLDAIRQKFPNLKKGKKELMPFICETLIHIYEQTLTGVFMHDEEFKLLDNVEHWEKRKKQFKQFSSNNEANNRFWLFFQEIYDNLSKLAQKKEAETIDLVTCMAMMICRAKEDLYLQYFPELIKYFQDGLKDKKERFAFFKSIKLFVTYLPSDYITKDLERFSSFVKFVSDQIFHKKVILNEHRQDAETFLVEYAKKQLHRTWPKLMDEILKPENMKLHTNEHRAVALSSIARVARLFPDEIGKQNYVLGVLCTSIFTDEKMRQDVSLLRNVLKCFPRVRNTSEEKMKEIRNIIGTHCLLHPDRFVSRNASEALVTSVELEPGKTFVDVVEKYREVLVKVNEISAETASRLLNDLYLVLETFIHKVQESEKLILGLDVQEYNSVRKKVEAMCLLYIINTSRVKVQAVKVLKQLSRPELKAITKEVASANTYLLDDSILVLPPLPVDTKKYNPNYMPHIEEMCKHHVDDAITKAWDELVKRWSYGIADLDLKRIELLANYLKFLCLSIRPFLSGKAESFLLELVQLLTKQNSSYRNHDKIKTAVLNALECLHPTSLYMLLTQIRLVEVQRTFIKKENRIESSDPDYEQHIISLLKRIITKTISHVSPTEFLFVKQGISVRDFFDELISNWTCKERIDVKDIPGSYLTLSTWKDAVEIVATYLKHLNAISKQTALEKSADIAEQACVHSHMFKKHNVHIALVKIFNFLHSTPLSITVQEAANAVQYLCAFGTIEDEKFINEIRKYFETVIVNNRNEVDIVPAMSEFLKNNPQTIRLFIINSYYESFNRALKDDLESTDDDDIMNNRLKKSQLKGSKKEVEGLLEKEIQEREFERQKFKSSIPHICKSYLSAIVKVMEDHLDHWIQEQFVTLGGMFYLALIHSCTRGHVSMRDKAHELINIIIKSDAADGTINYGTTYHGTSIGDESVFKKTMYNFSEFVSKSTPQITFDMFVEADKTVDLLDGVNRENTLRILIPWAYNFGGYVKTCMDNGVGDGNYKMKDFKSQTLLKHVYSLTEKLHGGEDLLVDDSLKTTNLNKHYLEKIWYNLIKSSEQCKWVIPETVKFIVENYDFVFSQTKDSANQPINPTHTLLRAVFVYICRDEKSLPFILENIVVYLRDYKSKFPETKKDIAQFIIDRGLESPPNAEISNLELSALQILVDITYEHDLALIPHLPKLFMNCIVLFNSSQNTRTYTESKLILGNICQSLAIRHRDQNTSTTSYVEKVFQFLAENLRNNNVQKLTRVRSFITQWTEYVSKRHRPDLAEAISEMALNWALQSKDNKISLESYYVFEALNKNFAYDVIEKLVAGFFDAVRVRDDAKISIIMDIFFNIPSDKLAPPKVSKLLFQVVFWLFFSWNRSHFARGLKYMLKLQSLSQSDNIDESVLNSSMYNVWKGYTGEETVDVSVARVIYKGIFDQETFADTFELYNNLIYRFDTFLPKGSNMLVATTLLIQAVLFLSGDFSKKQHLNKLFDKYANELAEFKTTFTTYEQEFRKVQSSLVTNEELVCDMVDHNKATTQFAQNFSSAFQKVFFNKNGNFVAWALISLPKNASINNWAFASLLLLSKLLPVIFQPGFWSIAEMSNISKVVMECMPDGKCNLLFKNPLFQSASRDIMEFISFHAHEKQQVYTKKEAEIVFPFLNPTHGFEKAVRSVGPSDNEAFVGTNELEKNIARTEIICRMWYQSFSLQIDPNANKDEAELLNTIIDFKSLESTEPVAPSTPVVANYSKVIARRNTQDESPLLTPPLDAQQVDDHGDQGDLNGDDDEPEDIMIPPPPESDSDDEETVESQSSVQ
ncbi:hypothetical protein FDP41_003253 [Naegleria fowleri]|uniref:Uncharacterized protein n=1 Tax=Naegleria fowleri TaxID=5763 RepID=A0A6A5BU61_NAEFO|nr:uncharacterized protein FDP41_003253 [Naegleria fowleri]KAF0977931.1 hypothetical protein FDP41_003253 [Naegleria fowleri]